MRLFLVRHGQTDWNVKGKIQGSVDSELNETGIKQAEELSIKIKLLKSKHNFSIIYTSPQRRAAKTAQILSQAVNADYIKVKGLEEINFGEWEGMTWPEIEKKYPEEYEEWYENRRYTRPPKGESYQDMIERVLAAIHKIIEKENEHENVVIVTHSAVIMCLMCYITNTPFEDMMKFITDNTAITEIDSRVLTLNQETKND